MSIMPEISYPFTQKLQYTQEFTITYNTLLQQSIFLSTKDWIELRDKTKTIVTVCIIPREIYSPLCSFCHFSYTFSLAIPASVSANYFFAKQWHHFPSCKLSKYWMSSRCVQYFCLSCLSIPTELHPSLQQCIIEKNNGCILHPKSEPKGRGLRRTTVGAF